MCGTAREGCLQKNGGKMTRTLTITKSKRYVGWVAKLDSKVPSGMPAIIPSERQDGFYFTEDMQKTSYALATKENPLITPDLWTIIFWSSKAFTNYNGFGDPLDPRANYVKGENLSYKDPKLMKALICSWNFYRGEVVGDKLRMTPGVHAIDGNKPMPSTQTILDNNWYFEAVSNDPHHSPFNQGQGGKVLIPYILKWESYYKLSLFNKWESDQLPQVSI